MDFKSLLILGVALLTWGGVFVYLLRLDAALKKMERQLPEKLLENEAVSPRVES